MGSGLFQSNKVIVLSTLGNAQLRTCVENRVLIVGIGQYITLESCVQVDKDQFDALLGKLMQAPPQPSKSIETQGKAGKIIPPIQPQSTPHKA